MDPKLSPKYVCSLFLLTQIVFLTRKVVNVVGIFNFTPTGFRGWVSRGRLLCCMACLLERESWWERKEFQYCRHKKWNCGKGTRKREKSFFINEPKKLCLLHSLNLAFFVCEGRSDGTVYCVSFLSLYQCKIANKGFCFRLTTSLPLHVLLLLVFKNTLSSLPFLLVTEPWTISQLKIWARALVCTSFFLLITGLCQNNSKFLVN